MWDWQKGKSLAKSTGHQERVFDLQFNPFNENGLVSCGVKQISFWTLIGNTLQKKKGLFGKTKDIQTMFCLAFSKRKDFYYTGTINGQVYVWNNNQLEEILGGVHNGSVFTIYAMPDGFITGGKDGCIRTWDANFTALERIELKSLLSAKPSAEFYCHDDLFVRSIFCRDGQLLVGTQTCEIYQLDMNDLTKVDCVCKGHGEGELWSLACSPVSPNIIATASDDSSVRYFNRHFILTTTPTKQQ